MRRFQTLLLLPALSGCSMMSVYEGGFNCPAGSAVKCKPISEVNEMINQGQIPPQGQENKNGDPLSQEENSCSTCKVNITGEGDDNEIWWAEPLWVESASSEYMRRFSAC